MSQSVQQLEKDFLNQVKKIEDYKQALSLLAWDSRTGAPKKGIVQRSEVIGTLSSEVFQMSTSTEMGEYLHALQEEGVQAELSEITRKTVEECAKEYERNVKIPKEEYKEYVVLQNQSESIWEEAKEKADFETFRPNLEKLVEFKKRFIGYWGYDKHPYNTLLDDYEPGVFVDTIDEVFGTLRDQLIPLVKGVTESATQPEADVLFERFPKANQQALSEAVLREIGYDFEAGRLDETVHPFAIGINPNDVRVTTKYNERDFRVSLFGTIHEGGHALYEQNISKELIGTPLCTGTSMGIHESQSLFWEKFVGKHYGFWQRNYELLKQHASGQFDNVSPDDFYFAVNQAKPSLIRIEADELTYCLHIILRYELEKGLFENSIEVKDLPGLWNEKMEEYLGLRPSHDGEGVLQDVHWSFGAFGYFPSYALGYIYSAQLKEAILKDIPSFDRLIQSGDYAPIREWLTKKVHQYGKMKKPTEIIQDITGGGIDSAPLIQYLNEKYRRLYHF
ncbi:carboxypeptidase M32 [Halalkalibacterium halodurans]|uniref:carboxypeptidase M32 n=1 Tax=Halalkalibacterium halodurans TaxID=86665 RepID=UPI002AA9FF08|nr:carboxypeptidase M32 [Halalkalibacterium halodurans]MDY7222707.1 carboxypeptidase M32 [Halalkalibacterium halodurans]MDY7241928.1 carboxypeptidase M32 [Halalkalibacterium halodurans]